MLYLPTKYSTGYKYGTYWKKNQVNATVNNGRYIDVGQYSCEMK